MLRAIRVQGYYLIVQKQGDSGRSVHPDSTQALLPGQDRQRGQTRDANGEAGGAVRAGRFSRRVWSGLLYADAYAYWRIDLQAIGLRILSAFARRRSHCGY